MYITGLNIGFLRYPCGCIVPVTYCPLYNKCYATRSDINTLDFLVFVAGKSLQIAVI